MGGMVAQEMQPMLLGPIPERYEPVIELQRELYEAGLGYMTPGREFADMIDFVNGYGDTRGMKTDILMHGRGYGDDGPLLTPIGSRREQPRRARSSRGTCGSGSRRRSARMARRRFSWGGCVLK